MADGGQAPGYERVMAISKAQLTAHGRDGAQAVWQGQALHSTVLFGERGNVPVHLVLTDDGMLYCRSRPDALLWAVSVLPPNACQAKRGAFWISRIDGREDDARFGRIHPFMISFINQRDVAVPYLGLAAVASGKKQAGPLISAVRALGGQVG
jgi:hypothetical protein